MPEDRSTQLDGRGALAAGLLLTALLLVTNNVILRAPLADYPLALALIGLGLAVLFIRPTPHQPESTPADLLIASAPASEPQPLPEWTLTAEPEPPASSAEAVEPLPNTDALALPKTDSSFEDKTEDETQAVDSVEVEEATHVVDSVEVEEVTQAVEPIEPDDLEKISGIGPKIAAALRDLGITTFAALASADEKQLQGALEAAGAKRLGEPSFWIRQALYAARGDWDGVQRVIDEHKAQRGSGG